MSENLKNEISKLCEFYRSNILNLTLSEMSVKTGINVKTLSSFENGKSFNINHIEKYCVGELHQINKFKNDLKRLFNKYVEVI